MSNAHNTGLCTRAHTTVTWPTIPIARLQSSRDWPPFESHSFKVHCTTRGWGVDSDNLWQCWKLIENVALGGAVWRTVNKIMPFDIVRPEQNAPHFPHNIFKIAFPRRKSYQKIIILSLDLFCKILLFRVAFLIFFSMAIFSPYVLLFGLLLQ